MATGPAADAVAMNGGGGITAAAAAVIAIEIAIVPPRSPRMSNRVDSGVDTGSGGNFYQRRQHAGL